MTFVKTTWVEGAAPYVTAAQLNRMEQGIADAHVGEVTRAHGQWYCDVVDAGPSTFRWGQTARGPDPNYIARKADLRGITLVKGGLYAVEFNVLVGNGSIADGRYDLQLRANGSGVDGPKTFFLMSRSSSGYAGFSFSRVIEYAASDYIDLYLVSGGSGVQTYSSGNSSWSKLSVTYLGNGLN